MERLRDVALMCLLALVLALAMLFNTAHHWW